MAKYPPIERIALFIHPKIERARAVADDVCRVLETAAATEVVAVESIWDTDGLRAIVPTVDAAITIGGDGSILRAARIAALSGTPILGVNVGKLGFLSEIEPRDVAERVPPLVAGDYWIEERVMLRVEHRRGDETLGTYEALNEAVVGRRSLSRIIRVPVTLDGCELTTYTADGVLVATPTGSTAYSFSAGGPILQPEVRSLILTPICPHSRMQASLVVMPDTVVGLTARTDHEAALSIDGQGDMAMHDGDIAVVGTSPYVARFIRAGRRDYFYRTLLEKLRL